MQRFSYFDYVSVGICIVDRDLKVLFWNDCLENWTGVDREDLLGNKVSGFFNSFESQLVKDRLEVVFQGGPPLVFSSQLHKSFFYSKYKQGKDIIQETRVSALPGAEPDQFYALFSVEDVTDMTEQLDEQHRLVNIANKEIEERKKAQEALKRSEKLLKDTVVMKDKMYSIIAHDLKTPFASLLGLSEVLLEYNGEWEEKGRLEILNSIFKASKQGFELLTNLLDWARSQSGQMIISSNFINLHELVHRAIEFLSSFAAAKKVTMENRIAIGSIIYADFDMMYTVMRNLISNAVKFSEAGGSVIVRGASDGDGKFELIVEDEGVGISEEMVSRMMASREFVSTLGTNNEKGTGLGFVVCKEFVEANRGEVSIKSTTGVGTEVRMLLPSSP